jgi:4'-phosphopantetheinyl transferase
MNKIPTWQFPEFPKNLAENEVHIFRRRVDPQDVATWGALLNTDESVRANRLSLPHKTRFIVARGWLRSLLGSYLSFSPQGLVFEYEANGKPYIAPVQNPLKITFNLSHSRDCVVLGVAREF